MLASYILLMWHVLLLIACLLALVITSVGGVNDLSISFQLMDATGTVSMETIQFANQSASIPKVVVDACRKNSITMGCRGLFRKSITKLLMENAVPQDTVIPLYTEFAKFYTEYIVSTRSIGLEKSLKDAMSSQLNLVSQLTMAELKLVLCVSHFKEDLSWLQYTQTPFIVVTKSTELPDDVALKLTYNRGNEVSSYLKYITQYYDSLPEFTLFLHGHNEDWHQYYNVFYIVEHLDYTKGYESINNVIVYPYDDSAVAQLQSLWEELFADELGAFPESGFREKCCAQFAVHRDRIHLRSLHFYQRLYDYVVSDRQDDANLVDGYHSSMSFVVEMVWHYIFGEQPIMDYSAEDSQLKMTSTSPLGQPLFLYV